MHRETRIWGEMQGSRLLGMHQAELRQDRRRVNLVLHMTVLTYTFPELLVFIISVGG